MTKIETMKLALDALEWEWGGEPCGTWEAIAALRQAISEAEQVRMKECRHCGWLCTPNNEQSKKWYPLEQAEQEPDCVVHNADTPGHFAIITPALPAGTKLYTAPPQREWVSLTDDEIINTEDAVDWTDYEWSDKPTIDFSRAIEAKLKEKNT